MKIIKTIGLLLFLLGFILFNASFFFSSYHLTAEMVEEKISDSGKEQLFLREAETLLNKEISSNFTFVARLNEIFSSINEKQIKLYAVTDEDVNKLVSLNSGKFSLATVESAFDSSSETSAFKTKTIKDYANWLDGQSFNSPEELRSQLTSIKDKINAYGILN
jgi:hypothetical protein